MLISGFSNIKERLTAFSEGGFMKGVATAIVNGRFVVFALFLVACIYCGLSVGRVQLENTLTAFLPESYNMNTIT